MLEMQLPAFDFSGSLVDVDAAFFMESIISQNK